MNMVPNGLLRPTLYAINCAMADIKINLKDQTAVKRAVDDGVIRVLLFALPVS